MSNKRNYLIIKNAPIAVVLGVWVPQVIYRFLVSDTPFDDVVFDAYLTIGIAILCYVMGAILGKFKVSAKFMPPKPGSLTYLDYENNDSSISNWYRIFRFTIIIISILFFLKNVALPLLNGDDMAILRDSALVEWSEGGNLIKIIAVGVNALACLLLLLISFEYRVYRKLNIILVILFIFVSAAAYARTLLLIGLFILLVRLIASHKRPIILVIKMVVSFVSLFLVLAIFSKDNSAIEGTVIDVVRKHAEIYFFGGVAGLNNFIIFHEPSYNAILSIPRFIQNLSSMPIALPPQYFDFVTTPASLNIFTAIYPPLHDFGIVGVGVFFFLYGLASAVACRKFVETNSFFWQTMAGFLLYATAMSVFDDQFLRGSPVFIIFLSVSLIFNISSKKLFQISIRP